MTWVQKERKTKKHCPASLKPCAVELVDLDSKCMDTFFHDAWYNLCYTVKNCNFSPDTSSLPITKENYYPQVRELLPHLSMVFYFFFRKDWTRAWESRQKLHACNWFLMRQFYTYHYVCGCTVVLQESHWRAIGIYSWMLFVANKPNHFVKNYVCLRFKSIIHWIQK